MTKRRAVSIVELAIGIALLVILASQVVLSTNLYSQTPKREAERLAKKLYSLMLKADKTQTPFDITIDPLDNTKITAIWNTSKTGLVTQADRSTFMDDFPASSGYKYLWWKNTSKLTYSPAKSTFTVQGTIKVQGSGEPYYVIVAVIGSRVRVSDTPPPD